MDISSIAPVIAIALIVIGGTIFVVRQWRRLKAADTRFYAERAELDQKWEYLFQLWREEREREARAGGVAARAGRMDVRTHGMAARA